jgi:hypothetical protein
VHAAGERALRIGDRARIAENVDRDAADRRQEHRQIGPGDKLGIHAAGLLEQRAAQLVLGHAEAFRDARQIPDRIDRRLGDRDVAGRTHDLAVHSEAAVGNGVAQFRNGQSCLGDRDGRADVDARRNLFAEIFRHPMAPRIERHDAAGVRPLRVRPDIDGGRRVGEVGTRDRVERSGGDRERPVERIGAAVGADGVAVGGRGDRADDRPALARGWRAPADRETSGRAMPGM